MKLAPKKKSAQGHPQTARAQGRRHVRRGPPRLMIAASENGNADMLYATRFYVPDAFIFLAAERPVDDPPERSGSGPRTASRPSVDEVLSLSEFIKENKKALGAKPALRARSPRISCGRAASAAPRCRKGFPLGHEPGAGAGRA